MSALNYLASLLQSSVSDETQPTRSTAEIDALLETLKARAKSRGGREGLLKKRVLPGYI